MFAEQSFVPRHKKSCFFAYAKTKAQISCADCTARKSAVQTAQLISAFVFASWNICFIYFLNPKFPAFNHFSACTAQFVSDLFGKGLVVVAYLNKRQESVRVKEVMT